jgi:hypothetical protein
MKKTAGFIAILFALLLQTGCSMPLSILNSADSADIYKAWGERYCTGDMYIAGNPEISLRLGNYKLYGDSILDKAPKLPACRYYLMLVSSGYSRSVFQTPSTLSVVIDEAIIPLNISGASTSGAKGKYLLSNAQDSPATSNADVYEMQPFNKKIVYYGVDARLIKSMAESKRLYLKTENNIYDLMKLDDKKKYAPQTFIEGCRKFYYDVVLSQCGPMNEK